VSSENPRARRVEQVEVTPSCANVITELVTEMPRCCSIFIQSTRAPVLPRALTSPADGSPAEQQQLLVSVVLPASGWEMIAKVRRSGRPVGRVCIL
jgi:hypothetical protein